MGGRYSSWKNLKSHHQWATFSLLASTTGKYTCDFYIRTETTALRTRPLAEVDSPAVIVGIEVILDQFLCCTAATVPLSQQRAFRVSSPFFLSQVLLLLSIFFYMDCMLTTAMAPESTGLLSPGASATGGNGRSVSPHWYHNFLNAESSTTSCLT